MTDDLSMGAIKAVDPRLKSAMEHCRASSLRP